jgi:hypothetical protein
MHTPNKKILFTSVSPKFRRLTESTGSLAAWLRVRKSYAGNLAEYLRSPSTRRKRPKGG